MVDITLKCFRLYFNVLSLSFLKILYSPSWSINFPQFIESKVSWLFLQKLATCPYHQPKESSSHTYNLLIKIYFNIIFPFLFRSHPLWFVIINNIKRKFKKKSKFFPTSSCYFLPLGSNILCPLLKFVVWLLYFLRL